MRSRSPSSLSDSEDRVLGQVPREMPEGSTKAFQSSALLVQIEFNTLILKRSAQRGKRIVDDSVI